MLNLAEDIYKNGLMGGQQITVVFSNVINKYIVYEGNRRVAAIKLLLRPETFDFLDKSSIERIKKLTNDSFALKQVECYVTDEQEAFFIMERRHSGEDKGRGVRPWSPREKEAFISRKSEKKSISYLIDFYIRKYFNDFDITTIISFTTLQRLFNNKAVRVNIGIDTNDEGTFTLERMQLIINAAKWAVKEAGENGTAITRMFNKAKVIEDKLLPWIINYKSNYQAVLPMSATSKGVSQGNDTASDNPSINNGNTATNNNTNQQNGTSDNGAPTALNVARGDANNGSAHNSSNVSAGNSGNLPYFFQGIDYSHLNPNDSDSHGIAAVCQEIRLFSDRRLVRSFPLSAAFLTRSIIEQSIVYYSKKHNIQGHNKLIWLNISSLSKLS